MKLQKFYHELSSLKQGLIATSAAIKLFAGFLAFKDRELHCELQCPIPTASLLKETLFPDGVDSKQLQNVEDFAKANY